MTHPSATALKIALVLTSNGERKIYIEGQGGVGWCDENEVAAIIDAGLAEVREALAWALDNLRRAEDCSREYRPKFMDEKQRASKALDSLVKPS